jgi:hypothetical protein
MFKYIVTFIALTDTISFQVTSDRKEVIEEFVEKLLMIFAKLDYENQKLNVEAFQTNTSEVRKSITDFVEIFKKAHPPINSLTAYFRKLKQNENFFFLPNIEFDQAENLKLFNYLRAISEGKSFEEFNNQTEDLFQALLTKYAVRSVGDKRLSIGEQDKTKRLCRFCDNKSENLAFNNKAHAISESLGNKTLVLFDECDICNKRISETIEPDIVQYLSLYRTIFDVKGKGGSKKFQGRNFDLKNEGSVVISIYGEENEKNTDTKYNLRLETSQPISLQNIYRSLCKYFISVIDKKYLPDFRETVKWINGERQIERLPKIGEMTSYHAFSYQPKLVTYIRKTEDRNLPYAVGEFYFTCKIFTFILPLSSRDSVDFTTDSDYQFYWQTFEHYNKSKGWSFLDYSSNIKKNFVINLNFELREQIKD